MTLFWIGFLALSRQPAYSLTFQEDTFIIRSAAGVEKIPIEKLELAQKTSIVYRKNDAFAVWDKRGLTLRRGSFAKSYHLEDVPLNPQIFEPEEIEAFQHEVDLGRRSLAASGISGSRRLGQRVYLLVRWDGVDRKTSFEVLVSVDLDAKLLKPTVVGRFDGVTGATSEVDDRLFLVSNGVAAVTRRSSDWGVAAYSFTSRSIDFVSLGQKLNQWYPSGLFLETTPYETQSGGMLDRETLQAKELFEDRNHPEWLDGQTPPIAVFKYDQRQILRNCDSGLEQPLSSGAVVQRFSQGILAWSPPEHPKHAVLLSYSDWHRLGLWNLESLKPLRSKKRLKRVR